jgi:hypothetical protein
VAVTGERVAKSLPLSELCAHRIVEITYVLVERVPRLSTAKCSRRTIHRLIS